MDPLWLKWLPQPVRRHIEGREHLQAVMGNSGWLFFDRVVRIGVGLVVSVWVARYLGPEQFGSLNYAIALVALFSAFSSLGLESIVIRDLSTDPGCAQETLGTAFGLRLAGAVLTLTASVAAIWLLRPEDESALGMVAIIAAGTLFQALDVIDFWYQSRVRSKFVVYARSAAYLAISLVKIALILLQAPLLAFAAAAFAEVALGACALLFVYSRARPRPGRWRFSWTRARGLLAASWPLFLSATFVLLYIQIDKIMIGEMLGERELGIFSGATQLAELWYFIPMAITASAFPAIVAAKHSDEALYYRRLGQLYLLMVWLALAVAIPLTLFARPVVEFVFGSAYGAGAAVLAIQCWAGLFIFSGLVSNHWYLLENLSRYTLYRHMLGAATNILLNLALIPRYGIQGAAVATIVTQFTTSYLFDLVNPPTRALFYIKSRYFCRFLPITLRGLSRTASSGNAR